MFVITDGINYFHPKRGLCQYPFFFETEMAARIIKNIHYNLSFFDIKEMEVAFLPLPKVLDNFYSGEIVIA